MKKNQRNILHTVCLYMIKRPEVIQQIIISGRILGDLCFLFKTCLFSKIFSVVSLYDFYNHTYKKPQTGNDVKICLSTLYTASKKTPAFQNLQAKSGLH